MKRFNWYKLVLSLFGKLTTPVIAYTMIFIPFQSVQADQAAQFMNFASGMVSQGLNEYKAQQYQMQQQVNAQLEISKMQQSMQTPQMGDSYFPGCKILPKEAAYNDDICDPKKSPLTQADLFKANWYRERAKANVDTYKQYSSVTVGQTSPQQAFGAQCLQQNAFDNPNSLMKEFDKEVAGLTIMISNVENEQKKFENETEKQMNAMKDEQGFLTGNPGGTKKQSDYNYKKLVGIPACNALFGNSQIDNVGRRKGGLIGMTNIIEQKGLEGAHDLETRKHLIKKELENKLGKLKSIIDQDGVADIENDSILAELGASGASAAAQSIKDYKREIKRIGKSYNAMTKDLGGLDLQSFAQTAPSKRGNYIANLEKQWKNDKLFNCLDNGNTGMSFDNILSLTKHNNGDSGDRTQLLRQRMKQYYNSYKKDHNLEKFYSSLASGDDSKVKLNLSTPYAGMPGEYKWGVNELMTVMLKGNNSAKGCEHWYSNSSSDSDSNMTNEAVVQQGIALLKNFTRKEERFKDNLIGKIKDRVLNCKGEGLNTFAPGPKTCSAEKMNSQSASFCMKQSLSCAGSFIQCNAHLATTIDGVKKSLEKKKNFYNGYVNQYTKLQDAKLKSIARNFTAFSAKMAARFPAVSLKVPEKMFVDGGVVTLNNAIGDLALLDPSKLKGQLSQKLKQIEKLMKDNGKELKKGIQEKQKAMATAYKKESGRWDKAISNCDGVFDAFNRQEQEKYKAAQEGLAKRQEAYQTCLTDVQPLSVCDPNTEISKVLDASTKASGSPMMAQAWLKDCGAPIPTGEVQGGKTLYFNGGVTEFCKADKGSIHDSLLSYRKQCDDRVTLAEEAIRSAISELKIVPGDEATNVPATKEIVIADNKEGIIIACGFKVDYNSTIDSLVAECKDTIVTKSGSSEIPELQKIEEINIAINAKVSKPQSATTDIRFSNIGMHARNSCAAMHGGARNPYGNTDNQMNNQNPWEIRQPATQVY